MLARIRGRDRDRRMTAGGQDEDGVDVGVVEHFPPVGVSLRDVVSVGVVGDVLSAGLDRTPTPAIYRPFTQKGGDGPNATSFSIVLRSSLRPDALAQPVREQIWRVDRDIPTPEIRTMQSLVARSLQQRRFQALLLSAFAVVAVLLGAIGVYGVVAYAVLQRRKEIGVRLALGAKQRDVGYLVFRSGMIPVLIGSSAGLVAAVFLVRLIASLLFQVPSLNPIAFFVASLILVLAGALPCWLTARRAARMDPVVALRLE